MSEGTFAVYEPPEPVREVDPNGELAYAHGELAITDLPAELPRYSRIYGCVIRGAATVRVLNGASFARNRVGVGFPPKGSPTISIPAFTAVDGCDFDGPILVVEDSDRGANLYCGCDPGPSGPPPSRP